MAKPPVHSTRRRFIKLTAAGLVGVPFANAMLGGNAEAADMVKESDPAAAKLKYKADATKAPERQDAGEFCDNCALYNSKDSAYGTCSALEDRLVAAKGWCTSWGG
jgi:High potential iron-sulfur protein